MVIRVQPQERTQERSKERKFILEGPISACQSEATGPETKGIPSKQVRRRQRTREVPFMGSKWHKNKGVRGFI